MENRNLKLDLNKIKDKQRISVSTKEAIKDVTPINWASDVLNGKRKVLVVGKTR